MKKYIVFILIFLITINYSCQESFLEKVPQGETSENVFYSEEGCNALLVGAYALLDGSGSQGWAGTYAWAGSVSNWLWGSCASDDAYVGATSAMMIPIERYEVFPTTGYVSEKWAMNYDGVSRANDVLEILKLTKECCAIEDDAADLIEAQAKFIRAWHHFELKRVYNNIPYITEEGDPSKVSNTIDAWPLMEADLQYAVDNLPESWNDLGRATKYAAMAVLARVHLFQQDWQAAKPLLDNIINSGNFSLMPNYHDNYKVSTNNNAESIFEIQYVVNDGTPSSYNGGYGDCLNFPTGGDIGLCCGFHVPSQNLVNAFKVDEDGLPLFDTFNDQNLGNDMGLPSSDEFIPDNHLVDPRLDWTVGRRGIPYLDWGVMRGYDWIRDKINGPYLYKKNMFYKAEKGIYSTTTGWASGVNANNYRAYRYAHILLWRAEVAIEENDLPTALNYINMVRERAANSVVMGRVTDYTLPTGEHSYEFHEANGTIDWSQPAANYRVEPYPSFPSQEYARKAVRWELRLEFAMEGHRFFDLVRWGIAAQTLNSFIEKDVQFRSFLTGADFSEGKEEYWAIPQDQIDLQNAEEEILVQNPGY